MKKFDKHIIIVGSARSGTSWVSETMAKQYRYRMLFEPEHDTNTTKGHLICDRLIIDAGKKDPATKYLLRVFSNRVDSDWIAQNSNRKWKRHLWPFIPKKFVIKFVRCNLSAQWMNDYFDIPVVHVIRNPYDVLFSQNRVKFPWLYDFSYFEKQENLKRLLKEYFDIQITNFSGYSDLEKLTWRWCIENLLVLKLINKQKANYEVIRYEELRRDRKQFEGLCRKFGLDPIPNLEEEYTKPSTKTHPKSEIIRNAPKSDHFNQEELEQINRILRRFSMNFYPIKN